MKTQHASDKARDKPAMPEVKDKHREVQALLDTVARSITAGDGEAVAKLWDVPAFVIGADMARPIASHDEIAEFFGGGKAQYNERGITDTRAEVVEEDWISDALVIVKVRWPYLDASGKELGGEASDYTLCRDHDGALKIRVITMRGVEPGKH